MAKKITNNEISSMQVSMKLNEILTRGGYLKPSTDKFREDCQYFQMDGKKLKCKCTSCASCIKCEFYNPKIYVKHQMLIKEILRLEREIDSLETSINVKDEKIERLERRINSVRNAYKYLIDRIFFSPIAAEEIENAEGDKDGEQ